MLHENYVLIGNIKNSTSWASANSKCYILGVPGSLDGLECLVRSRSGRMIHIWVRVQNVTNLRIKPLIAENPQHRLVQEKNPMTRFDWITEEKKRIEYQHLLEEYQNAGKYKGFL